MGTEAACCGGCGCAAPEGVTVDVADVADTKVLTACGDCAPALVLATMIKQCACAGVSFEATTAQGTVVMSQGAES